MSEKFTKGPWRVVGWHILNSFGRRIIQLFPEQYPDTADMALRDLLLAAPDMYEVLEGICNACFGATGDECKNCPYGKALRKARGEGE